MDNKDMTIMVLTNQRNAMMDQVTQLQVMVMELQAKLPPPEEVKTNDDKRE